MMKSMYYILEMVPTDGFPWVDDDYIISHDVLKFVSDLVVLSAYDGRKLILRTCQQNLVFEFKKDGLEFERLGFSKTLNDAENKNTISASSTITLDISNFPFFFKSTGEISSGSPIPIRFTLCPNECLRGSDSCTFTFITEYCKVVSLIHQGIINIFHPEFFYCVSLPKIHTKNFIVPQRQLIHNRDRNTDRLVGRLRRHTIAECSHEHCQQASSQCFKYSFMRKSRRLSHSGLLVNFEESALHGRLKPVASVDGFSLQMMGLKMQPIRFPIKTEFFDVSDDNTPSLYFGKIDLVDMRIMLKRKSRVQATLFNPCGRALKLFLIDLDLPDMPPQCNTFVRQRIFTPAEKVGCKPILRYLINLRIASDAKKKVYMHTDIKLLFSNKEEIDVLDTTTNKEYYKVTTEMPENPKYSMKTNAKLKI